MSWARNPWMVFSLGEWSLWSQNQGRQSSLALGDNLPRDGVSIKILLSVQISPKYNCKILLQKFMKVNQILNHNCVRRAGVCDKGPAHSGVSVNPEHCQIVIKQSGNHKHDLFRLGRWNVDPLHDKPGETVETLNRRKVDICCAQEVLWRGASTRTVTGKNSQYKFFWIGNETGDGGVGTFVAKKWIENVLDVKRARD